jgi:hypothetical protein
VTLLIQHKDFWELSSRFVLDSRYRFGNRDPVTKFVYQPEDEVLVLGNGKATPSHKALISSFACKLRTDTSNWVRGIVLREKAMIYYRQGVRKLYWYDQTTDMLRTHGLPGEYRILWGVDAKKQLAEDLADFP